METVTVRLPIAIVKAIDELVKRGIYPSRSAAVRIAVQEFVKRELKTWRELRRLR
ncbi:TPA: ribbon-helix-helix protein, CopG family [Candidatus Bathyarchaeota archaeon]|nr:ribbon-helix-helix protein, CopG family [Candidatus Bathyarchaeota archaeon]